jgi:hypothetical protein
VPNTHNHEVASPQARLSAMVILLSLTIISDAAMAANVRLKVELGGFAGGKCSNERYESVLAGAQSEIILIVNNLDQADPYRGLPSGPPPGLVLSASLTRSSRQAEGNTQALLDRIHPEFFVSLYQVGTQRAYEATGQILAHRTAPEYHFLISIPPDLAGQTLCIHATIVDSAYGQLSGHDCAAILAPCCAEDRVQVAASWVTYAYKSQQFERVVALTDSLLATGWRSPEAILHAQYAAHEIHRYDRELLYLDALFTTYGCVLPGGPASGSAAREIYEEQRRKISELRDQQQQH